MLRSQTLPKHARTLDHDTLLEVGRQSSPDYQLKHAHHHENPKVLAGFYNHHQLRPGLQLKCTDLIELSEMSIDAQIGSSLHLIVLLEGRASGFYGQQEVSLGRQDRHQAEALLFNVTEPERFRRKTHPGSYERKISISVENSWLADSGLLDSELKPLCSSHLQLRRWTPSLRACAIVAEMLDDNEQCAPALRKLFLESRTIELLGEAFGQASHLQTAHTRVSRSTSRLQQLREWLDSGAANELSLSEIAKHAGINPYSLQQQFRAAYGVTIFGYLRRNRLERARHALEMGALSISEAAWQAGYGSAANFATAFRRCFGFSPKETRRA
ncbi:AraC family transcriptional regulator [Uliginosibacterium aquaticum]|uniref:Helix-turn-helix transcriptional regulator n=1 Tax=Uliginosibacterium aquaticum TaxID=2731212 RepID=A0ABX2IFF1_9RHOO|nr:AraC family transcriptional regulator [Uliginosibacterium aquaticum]NSL54538.1 helix-turn-helix transcriptional regulator [Uliginosibacterium aquaticum]